MHSDLIQKRKGIVLAGGAGTRLHPLTRAVSKQMLPVCDKPMIYYPIAALMMSGIREFLIISTPHDTPRFEELLGDGEELGIEIQYAVQDEPRGIAEALIIAESFLAASPSALILGDNIFHGANFASEMLRASFRNQGASVFVCPVKDPERYGVIEMDSRGLPLQIVEKPVQPQSNLAVTGLYLYDERAPQIARSLTPSARGELEITDLNRVYLDMGELHPAVLRGGDVWFDMGTPDSLFEAAEYVRRKQQSRAHHIACLEEIALLLGHVEPADVARAARRYGNSAYGRHLAELIGESPA